MLTPDADLPEAALRHVSAWRQAVENGSLAYSKLKDQPAPRGIELASHFIHLMNNRLGIMPVEESYFATLIMLSEVGSYSS